MDTTKDDYSGRPDLPQNTSSLTPEQERKRSVGVLLGTVAVCIGLIALLA